MDLSYIITPFFAWLVAGGTKFAINSFKTKRLAFDMIGYGGMPSNHSSIVSSAVAIIVLKEGWEEPALVVALTLAFIVILDANSLRQQIGKHAKAINALNTSKSKIPLKERIGHTRLDICIGILTGVISATIIHIFSKH
ncbi:divergent PAP2 family protein [Vibrio breoganii]|uniref:divergent PAP2 family protein n=1 Tax=Vibrio breoganii TaxID=553239 RepID=UPI000C831A17|nr:divergent PAP2 family protein [Vibrio breoganii]PMG06164.1 acid phosphatase [Vibrio breoganii]